MTAGTVAGVPKVTNEKMAKILTKYAQGYTSPKEIARLTGINYNTVKEYLRRAREKGLIKELPEAEIVARRLDYVVRLVEEKLVKARMKGRRDDFLETLYHELTYIQRAYKVARKTLQYV